MDVGDAIEVMVMSKRGKQAEWLPATVSFIDGSGTIEVLFEGGSRQRFASGTDRLRMAGSAAREGEQWVF